MAFLDFFKNILSTKERTKESTAMPVETKTAEFPAEYIKVLEFNKHINKLLSTDKYIARSDYIKLISFGEVYEFFHVLTKSNLLQAYILKNGLQENEISFFMQLYDEIKDIKKESQTFCQHNNKYIDRHLEEEKSFLDNILKECDPNIQLDREQREVVLCDEDNILVIAGAGAGKTTTVAAKVRYLVEKKHVEPNKILIISFTNKAVEELKERINENLNIPCPVTTFHSVGYALLRKGDTERKKIMDGGFMYKVINEYLKNSVFHNTDMVNKILLFFSSYLNAPYEGYDVNEYFDFVAKSDCSTLKSNLHEYAKEIYNKRTKKAETLNNEILRSMQEVRIANFLYLNQIDYEYEPVYKYPILESNKPYTPDFIIRQGDKTTYIEHFGITEEGRNDRYTETELRTYKARVNEKILLHRKHKTDLIYIFSQYKDGISYIEHLREQLQQRGYVLRPRSAETVYKKLISTEESKYIVKLTMLICTFISNFKTQGYTYETFSEFKSKVSNVRTKLFLDICSVCYAEYQRLMQENNYIDFEDMINESVELIHRKKISKETLDFQYIIVDEYQDISRQRYNLIKELSQLCNAKIVAVGDDWQSIYAFSGSILPLFTQFCNEIGYGKELKITRTYRNAQEVIDIAGTFIQKNTHQIRKELISPKRITNPVIISVYDKELKKGATEKNDGKVYYIGDAVNNAIKQILDYNDAENRKGLASILLIGRYGFDARKLCFSKSFNYDERTGRVYSTAYGNRVRIHFLTAHSSKGLSADNVIIINAKDETYGFPSKVDDDPVLNLVVNNDNSYNYAEERRLFYVALTRTKNRVFIVTPSNNPSEFIKELLNEKENYPNVTLVGTLNTGNVSTSSKKRCPVCGYPLQFKWNKNYGLRLWICTNDQEMCGFMTNDLRGGELSIEKCDCCQDGFLIVKGSDNNKHFFLGCTNYKDDKSGCNRMLNYHQYKAWKLHGFGSEDESSTKTEFVKSPQTVTAPEAISKKETAESEKVTTKEPVEQKKPSVHTVTYREEFIESEGYVVMVDTNGNIITDMKLLKKLRAERYKIAERLHIKPYVVMLNKELARIATDKPMTKAEFIDIPGVGLKRYNICGQEFIEIIKEHNSRN